MKDWKGNKIQVGQTVIVIKFKSMFGGSKSRLIANFYDKEGNLHTQHKGEEFINPMNYCWESEGKYIITESRTSMFISFGDRASKIPIDSVDYALHTQPWQILAIEGISDNEQEFFEHHFK